MLQIKIKQLDRIYYQLSNVGILLKMSQVPTPDIKGKILWKTVQVSSKAVPKILEFGSTKTISSCTSNCFAQTQRKFRCA